MADFHQELIAGTPTTVINFASLDADAIDTGVFDNASNGGWLEAYLQATCTFGSSVVAYTRCLDLYLLPANATTYPDVTNAPSGGSLIWSFVCTLSSAGPHVMAGPPGPIRLPSEKMKFVLVNVSGEAVTSGSSLITLMPQKILSDEQ